ncbi:MAG: hypothetical protein FWG19_00050 [Methanomassiliicoccaceae archaeon]|nr:hypothetical protein [Methanomassiliicoccaceae archaeon]
MIEISEDICKCDGDGCRTAVLVPVNMTANLCVMVQIAKHLKECGWMIREKVDSFKPNCYCEKCKEMFS